MSKSRQKALAFTLLCLLIGVVHFFFGRNILSAVFYIIEIGLFWIIGAVIALGIIVALFELIFGEAALDKAEKWIDKKLGLDKDCECNCEACDCCECECECEDEVEDDVCDCPCCDECVSECDPDAVEEDTEESSESEDETEK